MVSKAIDTALSNEKTLDEEDALYERYGKPLEAEHWGKFIAIAPDGRTLLGADMHATHREGRKAFGEGVFLFHVGEKYIKLPTTKRRTGKGAVLSERISRPISNLYERYGKPLEAERLGEFVAITSDGRTMLGTDRDTLFNDALEAFGAGIFIFKVGKGRRE